MPLEESLVRANTNSTASHTYKDRFTANVIRCYQPQVAQIVVDVLHIAATQVWVVTILHVWVFRLKQDTS